MLFAYFLFLLQLILEILIFKYDWIQHVFHKSLNFRREGADKLVKENNLIHLTMS